VQHSSKREGDGKTRPANDTPDADSRDREAHVASQADGALAEEADRLREAVEELRVLNEVALALGLADDLDALLRELVRHSLRALHAEQGVIVLVEEHAGAVGGARTLVRTRAFTTGGEPLRPPDALLAWMHHHPKPLGLEAPLLDSRFGEAWPPEVRSVLAAPMLVGGRLVAVLTLYNKRDAPAFSSGDVRLLAIIAAQSAQVVERTRLAEARAEAEAERARVLRVFGQHTAPAVVEAILREGAETGPGKRQHVAVMFVDLRGFTARSEGWAPEEAVAYLNAFFEVAVEAVHGRRGVVHQLLGDGFMALFGAPVPYPGDCDDAVAAALDIVQAVEAACAAGRLPPTRVGIGLHAGEVVAGMVGSPAHREYKVTGDVVNVAARIEKLNRPLEARVLISEAVGARLSTSPSMDPLGPVELEGRAEPVVLFRLA
jgi:class 3 adenylate cyclase